MRKIYIFSFWALLACLVMTCFVKCFNSQPVIVFMGGGSAKEFIDSNFVKIDNFPRSFYLNLPSSYSWLSLVEEIEKTEEEGKNRTTIICLSADTINEKDMNDILKQHVDIFKTNRIIGLKLGEDSLCLYAKHLSINSNDNSITNSKLMEIIDSIKVEHIYTTKEESGTLRAYMNLLDGIPVKNETKKSSGTPQANKDTLNCDSIKRKLGKHIFYNFYKRENFEQQSYDLIKFFGSKYYKPKLDKCWKQYYITDTAKKAVTKPICIYFATYKNKMGLYTISAPVYEFLNHFKEKIAPEVWELIERRGNWFDEAIKRNKNQLGIVYLNKEEDKF